MPRVDARNARPCLFDRQCCSGFCDGRIVCRPGGPGKKRRNKNKRNPKNNPNRKNKPNRKRERCRDSERRCGGRCLNVRTNPRHCGRCDNVCLSPARCQGGACVCDVCPSGCAFDNVQDAVTAAADGDTITICPGTYTGGILIFGKDLTLVGAGAGSTILQQTGNVRLLIVSAGSVVEMRGVTMTNAGSGGIENRGRLTLTDCVVFGCRGANGGGILNSGQLLILVGTEVSDNEATGRGGGILNSSTRTLTAGAGCSIRNNTAATNGGGILNEGTMTLSADAIFEDNEPNDCMGPGCPP